jgi:predicted secreted protein
VAVKQKLKYPIVANGSRDKIQIELEPDTVLQILDLQNGTEKPLVLVIDEWLEKRSNNANGYMWVLLTEIAKVIYSSKEEVYEIMLQRYGKFTYSIEKPGQVERVIREWGSPCEILDEVYFNGQKGIQILKYYGSSGYNTKEMSVLIDGVVSEAQDLGIETRTPAELQKLKKEWKPKEK